MKTWFAGTSADGVFTGSSSDGATATGSSSDGATGSVTLADGRTLTFTAAQASIPAGLYERDTIEDGVAVRGRTIVLLDGSAKGSSAKTPTCAERQAQLEAYMEAWRRRSCTGRPATWAPRT